MDKPEGLWQDKDLHLSGWPGRAASRFLSAFTPLPGPVYCDLQSLQKGGSPMALRKSVFAGSWYPDTAADCERAITGFLEASGVQPPPSRPLVGGIVPHAGWFFSGTIACRVIHALREDPPPDVFVLFGMHLHPASAHHIMTEGAWETPFGNLSVQEALAANLARRFAFTVEKPGRYSQDNTIELQLPFIRYFFKGVKIVPIGVAPASSAIEIGTAAVDLGRELGLRVKVLGSTDLTHYGANYGFSPEGSGPEAVRWVRDQNDREIIDTMLAMNPQAVIRTALAHQNACCAGAAAAALAAGIRLGARQADAIAYATSYDKHPGNSFVGYVGIVF